MCQILTRGNLTKNPDKIKLFPVYALAKRLTQWGSCTLGEQGYSAIQILRHFYGDSIYINTAEQISGIPASWPGMELSVGSYGP